MEDALYLLLTVTAAGVVWWQHLRRRRPVRRVDEGLEIALHVASHEAKARKQAIDPLHLLYGLLQDDDLRARAPSVGADVEAIEKRVLTDLDQGEGIAGSTTPTLSPEAYQVLASVFAATSQQSRLAGCSDVLAALVRRVPAIAKIVETGGVRAVDLLVLLVHGVISDAPPPAARLAIVPINDNITTMEFVVEVLEQQFGLGKEEATRRMLEVHQGGRSRLGPYPAAEARERMRRATEVARSKGFPLLFKLEGAD